MGFDGFDYIEVILDIEEVFDLSIPDRDGEKLRTAGALCDYVVSRLSLRASEPNAPCSTATTFRRMRRMLCQTYGFARDRVRPSTRLAELLPAETSDYFAWRQLGQTLGVDLCPLHHPAWMQLAALTVGALASAAVIAFGSRFSVVVASVAAAPVAMGVFWLLLRLTRRRFATCIPTAYETVGAVSSLLLHDYAKGIAARKGPWSKSDVWEIVRCSIANSADIPPARVRKESRFGTGDLI